MGGGQLGIVVRHLHHLAGAPGLDGLSDGQLLERFARCGDQEAFTALVRRHGPMVFGVCRRVLRDGPDAEDAFQATFLVLFRRARSLRRGGSVANYLYTVAYHVALRARADAARRQRQERQVLDMPRAESQVEDVWRDLQPVLDEELNRLPEKYRAPVVLCYLEGKTNEEAARLLRCPTGTVKGRLARARDLLRARLARRGMALSAGALDAALAENASGRCSGRRTNMARWWRWSRRRWARNWSSAWPRAARRGCGSWTARASRWPATRRGCSWSSRPAPRSTRPRKRRPWPPR
jgi:RNA polymerase sigma-70 factor (ECF subfamily)